MHDLPVAELAGKVVLDTNNYMVWRDGHIPVVDSGERTVHQLRRVLAQRAGAARVGPLRVAEPRTPTRFGTLSP